MASRALVLVGLAAVATACGSAVSLPQQHEPIRSGPALAARCGEAAREHLRPFVVEWDATDLASFEAKAARGTVAVRYEGCKLEVIYECTDPLNPAQFGSYGSPHLTSGGAQTLDITNQGELYANLPLGAVKLSARLAAGETLHLKYFVSGVATSTRDVLYRGELERYPTCARATHYVWAYNLGAFELKSTSRVQGEAQAGLGKKVGGGGSMLRDYAGLSNGGELASCSTQDQRACRVPIRLALRPISAGNHPAGTTAVPVPVSATAAGGRSPVEQWQATPAGQAHLAYMNGIQKLDASDGTACLASLNRALALDARQFDNVTFKTTRARCLMRAGQCDQGTKDLRATLAAQDASRQKTNEQLDGEASHAANRECSAASAKNDPDYVIRAGREMQAAALAKDGRLCRSTFDAIAKRVPRLPPGFRGGIARNHGLVALDLGALCVARTLGCNAGLGLWKRKYALALRNVSGLDKIATDSWTTLLKLQKIECR